MDPKIGMYSKNRVGQVRFENFDFLVIVKDPTWSKFFSFFFFFFFFCKGFGPGHRFESGPRNRVKLKVEGDVFDDVIFLY